ncbi:MAG: hypothetical protein KAV00_13330 [Phycisphaerae bacterium]|nr:hypothetical protein [Phycisphaerae bacterium]
MMKPSERFSKEELAADPDVQKLVESGRRQMEGDLEEAKAELADLKRKKEARIARKKRESDPFLAENPVEGKAREEADPAPGEKDPVLDAEIQNLRRKIEDLQTEIRIGKRGYRPQKEEGQKEEDAFLSSNAVKEEADNFVDRNPLAR